MANREVLEAALCEEHVRAVVASVSGGMAHHFNNLLSGVLGLVSLAPSLDPVAMANLGERLKAQIDHASRLIRVVLTLTRRADSEGATGQCEAVGQARDVVALAAVTASAAISVEPELPEQEVLLHLSPVALDRILLVLLTAAIDRFGNGDGVVRLAVEPGDDQCDLVVSAGAPSGRAVETCADVVSEKGVDRAALSKLAAIRLAEAAGGRVEFGEDGSGLRWTVALPRLRLS